jgi:glutamate transport system permease protein
MEFWRTFSGNYDLFQRGFLGTISLTAVSALFALVLGVVMAGCRVSPVPPLRTLGTAWVNTIRNTPLTLLFFAAALGLPKLLDPKDSPSYYVLAVITLSLYTSAFVCEAVRSGINTVPVGQAEAARSLGMTFTQTLGTVVLPQAGRTVIGPIGSILIALTKNSALAGSFNVAELFSVQATLTENGSPIFAVFIWIALGYLVLTLGISALFRLAEKRWAVAR